MNKLTILVAGGIKSGKSCLSKSIYCDWINSRIKQKRFTLEKSGKEVDVVDTFNNGAKIPLDYPNSVADSINSTYGVKIYKFTDSVKQFAIDTLGLDIQQCFGSESDMDSESHIAWEDIFDEIKEKHRSGKNRKIPIGNLTAREVINIICIDVLERFDKNCWTRSLLNKIEEEAVSVAIIDGVFNANQITIGTEKGAKAIRLGKNENSMPEELKSLPLGEFHFSIQNCDLTMVELHKKVKIKVEDWFRGV